MKNLLCILAAITLLVGCSDKQQEAKVAALENRIEALSSDVSLLKSSNSNLVLTLAQNNDARRAETSKTIAICKLFTLEKNAAIELELSKQALDFQSQFENLQKNH